MTDALQALRSLSDADRAGIGRIMRGEADEDQLRRGDVHKAIRSLRTNPVPSKEYQRALSDVQKLVSRISHCGAPMAPVIHEGDGR